MNVHIFLLLLGISIVYSSDDVCAKEEWIYLKTFNVSIRKMSSPVVYNAAKEGCSRLGSDLTKFQDQKLVESVFKTLKPETKKASGASHVWVGAHYDENSATFEWFDGNPVEGKGLDWKAGEPDLSDGKGCVVMDWEKDGKWFTGQCSSKASAFCEAKDPCSLIITLRNDNSIKTVGGVWTFEANKSIVVHCSMGGLSSQNVDSLTLACPSVNATTKDRAIARVIRLNRDMSNKKCECAAAFLSGQVAKKATVTLRVKTTFALAPDNPKKPNFNIKPGEGVTTQVSINAYTPPTKFTLFKDDEKVQENLFMIRYVDGQSPNWTVVFTIFEPVETGQYVLKMSNEIGDPLNYYFEFTSEDVHGLQSIKSEEVSDESKDEHDTRGFIFNTFFVVCCAGIIFGVIAQCSKRKSRFSFHPTINQEKTGLDPCGNGYDDGVEEDLRNK